MGWVYGESDHFEILRELMGKDCIGCGFCCRKSPCGEILKRITWSDVTCGFDYTFDKTGKEGNWEKDGCPALEWSGEKWRCSLYTEESSSCKKQFIAESLFFGEGCCSGLNTYQLAKHVPTPVELEEEGKLVGRLLGVVCEDI